MAAAGLLRAGLWGTRGRGPVLLSRVCLTRPAAACALVQEHHHLQACNIHTSPRSSVIDSLVLSQKQQAVTNFSNRKGLECISPLFSSVEETPHVIPTKIQGHIPKWLKGKLLRNGPGKFEFGEDKYNHWFDGMALLHKFEIEDGIVKYSSKFLRSDSYVTNSKHNRIMIAEFGTMAVPDPCKTVFERFMSTFEMPSTCCS